MKQAGMIVGNYAPALATLQTWLRKASSLEWPNYVVLMTPQGASLHPVNKVPALADIAVVVPLAPVCRVLSESVEDPDFYQYSLLGLQAVRKAK